MAQYTIQNIGDTFIDSTQERTPGVMKDSVGNLYVVYRKFFGGNYTIVCAQSTDSGVNWSEIGSFSAASDYFNLVSAIDSSDKIHIAYEDNGNILAYRYFVNGTWSNEETIYTGGTDSQDIAVNSQDIPIVTWVASTSPRIPYYSARTGGVWETPTDLSLLVPTATVGFIRCAINSQDEVYVIFRTRDTALVESRIWYAKYNGISWVGPATIDTEASSSGSLYHPIGIVIDSSDNVHVVYPKTTSTSALRHAYYTDATDTWATENISTSGTYTAPTIGIDNSDVMYVIANNTSLYTGTTGVWSGASTITTVSSFPALQTPIYPILEGVSSQIPTSGYHVAFINATPSFMYETGTANLPAPADSNYSREANASLPSNDGNLDNLFTSQEYTDVATVNNVFALQTATDEYSIELFKNKGNSSSDPIYGTWIGQSDVAPTSSTIYLQIYNRTSGLWETVDSNSTTSANINFALSCTKTSGLSDYYDASNWVSFRVYQLAV